MTMKLQLEPEKPKLIAGDIVFSTVQIEGSQFVWLAEEGSPGSRLAIPETAYEVKGPVLQNVEHEVVPESG